jgi:hypothetical protein
MTLKISSSIKIMEQYLYYGIEFLALTILSIKYVYGITHKLDKPGNPFYINFYKFIDMGKDMRRAYEIRKIIFYIFVVTIDSEKDRVRFKKYSENDKYNNILDITVKIPNKK